MKRKYQVFISYSRKDADLISPLVKLLRLDGKRVFRDLDCINPGEKWDEEIRRALQECKTFVLFWCCHSSHSEWIAKEIDGALSPGNKQFIPVLLCGTPVPDEVRKYQWIDFRHCTKHCCLLRSPDVKDPHVNVGLEDPLTVFHRAFDSSLGHIVPREFSRVLPQEIVQSEWKQLLDRSKAIRRGRPVKINATPTAQNIAVQVFDLIKTGFRSKDMNVEIQLLLETFGIEQSRFSPSSSAK